MRHCLGKYLKLTGFILLYVSIYFIVSNYIGSAFGLYALIRELIRNPQIIIRGFSPAEYNRVLTPVFKNIILLQTIAAVLSIPLYFFVFHLRRVDLKNFIRLKKTSAANMLISAVLGVVINLALSLLVALTAIDKLSPEHERFMFNILTETGLWVGLIGIGIIIPITEELLFRGLVFNELRKNIPLLPSILIQALIFGAFHGNLTQFLYTFVMGIVLALVYLWSDSLWPPVLVHIFLNSTSILISKLGNSGWLQPLLQILALLSIPLTIVFLVAFFRANRRQPQF